MSSMDWYNSLIKSIFKLIVIIGAVPIFIGIVIFLFWIGFGLDYGNQESSTWIIALPGAFILFVVYGAYSLSRRSKRRHYEALKDKARQEVLVEMKAKDPTQRF